MIAKLIAKLAIWLLSRTLKKRIDGEIFDNLFPHLNAESDEGYPFASDEELVALTESMNVQRKLNELESQIRKLPRAYGQCFRYLMRKDLHQRMNEYLRLAKRREQPKNIDPRFVARAVGSCKTCGRMNCSTHKSAAGIHSASRN